MGKYILVHDVGTTGDKAIIFDEVGRIKANAYMRYETYYPQPTWYEQSPEEWWQAVRASTREVMKKAEVSSSEVQAVSLVGQTLGAVPVDKGGIPVRKRVPNVYDARSSKQARKIVEKTGGFNEFYKYHGLGHTPEILSLCKVMWLRESEPSIYKKTFKFLQSKDFIINRFTDGEIFVDDYTDASNTGWLDVKKRAYSKELLKIAGLDLDKLPELHESYEIVGNVGDVAAKETDLRSGTPIIAGSGDVSASCIGAGILKEEICFCNVSSTNILGVYSKKPLMDSTVRVSNMCHPWKNYVVFTYTQSGAVIQDWGINLFCDLEKGIAEKENVSVYDLVTLNVKRAPPGSGGLIYLPYIRGGGAPHWNPNARGAIVGFVMPNKKEHVIRALLEGVALNFRWSLEQLKTVGTNIREIRATGGGVRNREWMKIYADVVGRKLIIMEMPQEASGRGGFLSGAVGLRWFKNYQEAIEKAVKVEDVMEPNMKNHNIYNQLYDVFKSACGGLSKTFNEITNFQTRYGISE